MNIFSSEWKERVDHWVRTLIDDLYEPIDAISWTACETMEHVSLEDAKQLPFRPVEEGFTWGKTWEYCWFRGTVKLPACANGKRIIMKLDPSGEATLFVNDQAFGT